MIAFFVTIIIIFSGHAAFHIAREKYGTFVSLTTSIVIMAIITFLIYASTAIIVSL